ncbi:hypothetical protein ACQJBY_007179 [Aegilops geniculata]
MLHIRSSSRNVDAGAGVGAGAGAGKSTAPNSSDKAPVIEQGSHRSTGSVEVRAGKNTAPNSSDTVPVVRSTGRLEVLEEEDSDDNAAGNGSQRTTSNADSLIRDLQAEGRKLALERFRRMCCVLGADYNKRLSEMGCMSDDDVDMDRLYKEMDLLDVTINSNYKKLKDIGSELFLEWGRADTPLKDMLKFSYVISVHDSTTPAEIDEPHFLDTLWVKKARTELDDRRKDAKKEYQKQKEKLKGMIHESHLTYDFVGFNPKEKVDPKNYYQETCKILKQIEKIRELSVSRKEMVYRMERVQMAIAQNKLPTAKIKDLKELAMNHVKKISVKGQPIIYNGEDISTAFDNLESEIDALEEQRERQLEKEARMLKTRTRSGGASLSVSSESESD